MLRYDSSVTVFSPDGCLYQVLYAREAVSKCSTAVGVAGSDCVVFAVQKKQCDLELQRTASKVRRIDEHIMLTYAGLTPDARVLIKHAREECQSYSCIHGVKITVENITLFLAKYKQIHTQMKGARPFGVSCLIGGFNKDSGAVSLFQTDPTGVYYQWRACTAGHLADRARAYLEKSYSPLGVLTVDCAIKLAVRALMEVGVTCAKDMEVVVMKRDMKMNTLDNAKVECIIAQMQEKKLQTNIVQRAREYFMSI